MLFPYTRCMSSRLSAPPTAFVFGVLVVCLVAAGGYLITDATVQAVACDPDTSREHHRQVTDDTHSRFAALIERHGTALDDPAQLDARITVWNNAATLHAQLVPFADQGEYLGLLAERNHTLSTLLDAMRNRVARGEGFSAHAASFAANLDWPLDRADRVISLLACDWQPPDDTTAATPSNDVTELYADAPEHSHI